MSWKSHALEKVSQIFNWEQKASELWISVNTLKSNLLNIFLFLLHVKLDFISRKFWDCSIQYIACAWHPLSIYSISGRWNFLSIVLKHLRNNKMIFVCSCCCEVIFILKNFVTQKPDSPYPLCHKFSMNKNFLCLNCHKISDTSPPKKCYVINKRLLIALIRDVLRRRLRESNEFLSLKNPSNAETWESEAYQEKFFRDSNYFFDEGSGPLMGMPQ